MPVDVEATETNFVAISEDRGDGMRRGCASTACCVGDLRPGVLRAVTHLGVSDDDVERAIELHPARAGAARVRA